MAQDSSFDVVSRIDMQEVRNALQQAHKEITQRFDFKGTQSTMDLEEEEKIHLVSEDEGRLRSVLDVLQSKLVRRGISLKSLEYGEIEPTSKGGAKQDVTLQSGLGTELAKEIVRDIKELKLKVQAQIQDDQVRVSSKSKDDLQKVMAFLRGKEYSRPVQFTNYR